MKEYPIEIIKLAEKLNLKSKLTGYVKKVLKNKIDYDIIVNATLFLDHNPIFRERLYYIINNLHSRVLCEECGINFVKFKKPQSLYLFCSSKCVNLNNTIRDKITNTNQLRYGSNTPAENKDILIKMQKTCIDKYGVINPWQSEKIKGKIKNTNLKNLGVEHPSQSNIIKKKKEITFLEKYGVINPSQSNIIKKKKEITFLEKYGEDSPFKIDIFQKKKLKSQQQNYHQRFLETCNEKYGNQYAYPELKQSHDEISIWCKDHGEFSVMMYYHMQGKECPICYPFKYGYSQIAIKWLNYISEKENIHIQHAENEGELRINIPNSKKYYFVDGFCKENNTVYEFNGDCFHGNPAIFEDDDTPNYHNKSITAKELYNKTIEKENDLKSLGYNVVSIWESEWLRFKNELLEF